MRFEAFSFGSIRIDGVSYTHDVVIDRGQVRKRKKQPSEKIPRYFWAHTAINQRGYTLEMPAACDRHRDREITGHGRGEARGQPSAHQIGDPADGRSDRGVEGAP